jgi:drug/metabolite transporter (DMT)-like permease
MVIAFTGVVVIGSAKTEDSNNSMIETTPYARVIGLTLSLTVAICYSLVSVLTRKMQKIHYSVVLVYYGAFSVIALTLVLVIESLLNGEPLRFINVTWEQLLVMAVASSFNTVGIISHTISLQNEKSGFITAIGYVSLIYAFAGDVFIFGQTFSI